VALQGEYSDGTDRPRGLSINTERIRVAHNATEEWWSSVKQW